MTAPSAPRDDLIRMIELPAAQVEFRADDKEDGTLGTLRGYAAVFNEDTVIDSWEGRFVERIMPGAFERTLVEDGPRIKVLFNHGFDPSIGDKPLGKPRVMREDKRGLYVEVPLDDTSYNRDIVASLRSGALDGQSFRFSVKREEWEDAPEPGLLPTRTLMQLRLYEFGPVTFPAYEATTAGVRAREAYAAWRTARATESNPAPAGTAEAPRDDAADPGTSSPVVAPSVKERAQAIAAARAVAA
jgi:HK97 family phage prohead protease